MSINVTYHLDRPEFRVETWESTSENDPEYYSLDISDPFEGPAICSDTRITFFIDKPDLIRLANDILTHFEVNVPNSEGSE
jgi:hypothetical protein